MNTEMMERFEVLDADRLASVEGGKVGAGEFFQALGSRMQLVLLLVVSFQ